MTITQCNKYQKQSNNIDCFALIFLNFQYDLKFQLFLGQLSPSQGKVLVIGRSHYHDFLPNTCLKLW